MKVSITKKTTKKDLLFDNHLVRINGCQVGVVGRSHLDANEFTFFSHCEDIEQFDGKKFNSLSECKQLFRSL